MKIIKLHKVNITYLKINTYIIDETPKIQLNTINLTLFCWKMVRY